MFKYDDALPEHEDKTWTFEDIIIIDHQIINSQITTRSGIQ